MQPSAYTHQSELSGAQPTPCMQRVQSPWIGCVLAHDVAPRLGGEGRHLVRHRIEQSLDCAIRGLRQGECASVCSAKAPLRSRGGGRRRPPGLPTPPVGDARPADFVPRPAGCGDRWTRMDPSSAPVGTGRLRTWGGGQTEFWTLCLLSLWSLWRRPRAGWFHGQDAQSTISWPCGSAARLRGSRSRRPGPVQR